MYGKQIEICLPLAAKPVSGIFPAIGLRAPKAPLALRPYHRVLWKINLHINLWHRAGAARPFGALDPIAILSGSYKRKIMKFHDFFTCIW